MVVVVVGGVVSLAGKERKCSAVVAVLQESKARVQLVPCERCSRSSGRCLGEEQQ